MAKLIVIAGNNASGKTCLTKALCRVGHFSPYLESHEDRPYQLLFAKDQQRYALPNQLDFMLRRAEQEAEIRAGERTGVQDGGLDQDFRLYTRLFHHKGFLDDKEFDLCRRTYHALRAGLPKPDLIVRLRAPLPLLRERLLARGRMIDLETIATLDDLPFLESCLDEWMDNVDPADLLEIDASKVTPDCSEAAAKILEKL